MEKASFKGKPEREAGLAVVMRWPGGRFKHYCVEMSTVLSGYRAPNPSLHPLLPMAKLPIEAQRPVPSAVTQLSASFHPQA